jgi:hypothetical protein
MMRLHRLTAFVVAAAVGFAPAAAPAAGSPVAAFVAKNAAVDAGAKATFELGVTSTDATTWPRSTVVLVVDIFAPDGTNVASSGAVSPPADVAPGKSTFAFIDVPLPAQLSGAYTARATVVHAGAVAGEGDPVAIAVATLVAAAPPPGGGSAYSGQFTSNDTFAARSAQAGTFALTGKYGADRSFQANFGLSSTPGQQQPVFTVQTTGSITQIGTFSPSLDPLVFAGATGSGAGFKRVWPGSRILSVASISGAHATANPYSMDAVSYAFPVGPGIFTVTYGDERVEGDVPYGLPFFLRSGTLTGFTYQHPSDAHRFSYGLRYGLVNYEDAVAGVRRTDRALEAQLGFAIRKSSWTLDVARTGPYFPNLAAPGVTPDRESESLQGSIPVGVVALNVGITGYRDALPGSPSEQKTHFYTENVGLSVPLRNGDALALTVSNATQHREAIDALASGNDNSSLSYTARRGSTSYAFTLGSANQRDSTGNLQHTVLDGLTVTRAFGPYFSLATGVNFTGNHASAMSGTSVLQAFAASATYTRGDFSLSSALNRSNVLPYLGIAPVPTTALNYGLSYRPAKSHTSLSATITQNSGAFASSNGSLNLSRQL